jgi:hypothetical protein
MIEFTLNPRGLRLRVQSEPGTLILILVLVRLCQRFL